MDTTDVFFVKRLISNAGIVISESFLINEKHDHILIDRDIELKGFYSSRNYPKRLLTVKVYDPINDQTLVLLTNNISWTGDTILRLYKARMGCRSVLQTFKTAL